MTHPMRGGRRTRGIVRLGSSDRPLVSVVTVVFNGAAHVRQTIESVLGQSYDNIEYLVIDGGSTDGTVDIIRQFDDRIDYWASERDHGIFDAMNKGLALAKGELTNLLNADDYYADRDVIADVVKRAGAGCRDSMFAGNTLMMRSNGLTALQVFNGDMKALYYRVPFMHPSCFIPKALYDRHGVYDVRYKVAADVDLLLRMIRSGVSVQPLRRTCVVMREGGVSTARFGAGRLEYASIFRRYYHNAAQAMYGLLKSMVLFRGSALKRSILGKH